MPLKRPYLNHLSFHNLNVGDFDDIDVRQHASRALSISDTPASAPKVLILTDVYDYESDKIGRLLLHFGVDYARINASYIPSRITFSIELGGSGDDWFIRSGEQLFSLKSIKAILYRNFYIDRHPFGVDAVANSIYEQEWNAALSTLFGVVCAPTINGPYEIQRVNGPAVQLSYAKAHGFNIPRSLLTSDATALTAFINGRPERFIIKAIGLHRVAVGGAFHSYYASSGEQLLEHLGGEISTPVLVQEKIQNTADVRVTFIGRDLFVTKIDRPPESDCIDYKALPLDKLTYSSIELPNDLEQRCRNFIDQTGLFYGAIDFVCTNEGRFFFMEVNSCPDWHWLEHVHSYSITEAFARVLSSKVAG